MLEYLDTELSQFVENYVTSFLTWDLLVFFHKNPDTIDTAGDLAVRLGRRAADIERAAQELVGKAVLAKNANQTYEYAPDDEQRSLVAKFVTALDDREKRLLILTNVLQKR